MEKHIKPACSTALLILPFGADGAGAMMTTQAGEIMNVATLAWHCTVPTVPRWRDSGRHIPVKTIYFLPCYFLFIPTAFMCTRIKQTPYKKNIKC
jgi:hypothetical protein